MQQTKGLREIQLLPLVLMQSTRVRHQVHGYTSKCRSGHLHRRHRWFAVSWACYSLPAMSHKSLGTSPCWPGPRRARSSMQTASEDLHLLGERQ